MERQQNLRIYVFYNILKTFRPCFNQANLNDGQRQLNQIRAQANHDGRDDYFEKTETDAGDSIYDDDSDDNDDDDDDDDDIVSQPGGDRDNKKTSRADTSSPVPIQMKTCCVKIKAGDDG